MNIFQSIYLSYFSSPVENRGLYQAIGRLKPQKIVEFGIQRGVRTANVLELAKKYHKAEEIEYYCVDPFEGRTVADGPGLSLRKAHKMLVQSEVKARAIPCMPEESFTQLSTIGDGVRLMIIATPSLSWALEHRTKLVEIMDAKGMIFLGVSDPSGASFELTPYTIDQFQAFNPLRRAAA